MAECSPKGKKHGRKRINCPILTISPFCTVFSNICSYFKCNKSEIQCSIFMALTHQSFLRMFYSLMLKDFSNFESNTNSESLNYLEVIVTVNSRNILSSISSFSRKMYFSATYTYILFSSFLVGKYKFSQYVHRFTNSFIFPSSTSCLSLLFPLLFS